MSFLVKVHYVNILKYKFILKKFSFPNNTVRQDVESQ